MEQRVCDVYIWLPLTDTFYHNNVTITSALERQSLLPANSLPDNLMLIFITSLG